MILNGYKQTEIGVIPEDWDCVVAKHLMKIETGSRNTEHKTDIGKYPFFVRSQKVERIDTYHYDCEAVLTAGDGVGTGKVFHHYIGKFDAHQRVYVMSDFKGITGRFFYNYFSENFSNEVSKYTAKSSVDSVRRDMIAEMLIPTPTIPEQERIAEALSDVDSMISALEKLIAKKKAIKQGAMQELLTGKKRLPGFTGEWHHEPFGKLCTICRGGSPRPIQDYLTTSDSGINWIKIGDVKPNAKYITSTQEKIVESGVSMSRRVYKGDFILSNSMSFGRPYILKLDGCIHDGWLAIQDYQVAFDTDFLYYVLGSNYVFEQYIQMAAGSSVQNLNKDKVAKLDVFVPPMEEQSAIASILSDMDNEIEALEQKLEKTRQIKQGMMQQLLTGKIRLV